MEKILEKQEGEYKFWYKENKNLFLLKNIEKGNYRVIKEFKNSDRNYVAEIEINEERILLKNNRKEYKKIFCWIKKVFSSSEGVEILKNQEKVKQEGFKNFAKILGAVEKRKYRILKESYYILEMIDGEICSSSKQKDKALEEVKKLHNLKRYHGDCNPCNFLEEKTGEVKIIDSKLKRMFFGDYRAHYDMLTMKIDSYQEMKYPYKKNIFYYIAFVVKKIKKFF